MRQRLIHDERREEMRIRTLALVVTAALALAASALAASAARDPSTLILQRKDFPAHSDYDASPGADGFELKPALEKKSLDVDLGGYLGETYSKKKGMLIVRGAVITTPSLAKAKQVFEVAVKARQAFWKLLGAKYTPFAGVPSFGDQQLAFAKKPTVLVDGSMDVVVRKRTVVWLLEVVVTDRQPPPPMSEIVADLKMYAAKEKSRVGAG
jgi:hypothetical protein